MIPKLCSAQTHSPTLSSKQQFNFQTAHFSRGSHINSLKLLNNRNNHNNKNHNKNDFSLHNFFNKSIPFSPCHHFITREYSQTKALFSRRSREAWYVKMSNKLDEMKPIPLPKTLPKNQNDLNQLFQKHLNPQDPNFLERSEKILKHWNSLSRAPVSVFFQLLEMASYMENFEIFFSVLDSFLNLYNEPSGSRLRGYTEPYFFRYFERKINAPENHSKGSQINEKHKQLYSSHYFSILAEAVRTDKTKKLASLVMPFILKHHYLWEHESTTFATVIHCNQYWGKPGLAFCLYQYYLKLYPGHSVSRPLGALFSVLIRKNARTFKSNKIASRYHRIAIQIFYEHRNSEIPMGLSTLKPVMVAAKFEQDKDTAEALLNYCVYNKIKPDYPFFSMAVHIAKKHQDVELVTRITSEMVLRWNMHLNTYILTDVLSTFLSAEEPQLFKIYEQHVQWIEKPGNALFRVVLQAASFFEINDYAQQVLRDIIKFNVTPEPDTVFFLLNCCYKNPDLKFNIGQAVELADFVLEKCRTIWEINLTEPIARRYLNILCLYRDENRFYDFFHQIQIEKPELISSEIIDSMLQRYAEDVNISQFSKMWRYLKSNKKIPIKEYHYRRLIHLLTELGRSKQLIETFEEIKTKFSHPEKTTLHKFIEGIATCGDQDDIQYGLTHTVDHLHLKSIRSYFEKQNRLSQFQTVMQSLQTNSNTN